MTQPADLPQPAQPAPTPPPAAPAQVFVQAQESDVKVAFAAGQALEKANQAAEQALADAAVLRQRNAQLLAAQAAQAAARQPAVRRTLLQRLIPSRRMSVIIAIVAVMIILLMAAAVVLFVLPNINIGGPRQIQQGALPTAPANATPDFGDNTAPAEGVGGGGEGIVVPTALSPGLYVYPGYDAAGKQGLYNWLAAQLDCSADSAQDNGKFATFYTAVIAPAYLATYKSKPQDQLRIVVTSPEMANGCR